jgi:hypothetical protein
VNFINFTPYGIGRVFGRIPKSPGGTLNPRKRKGKELQEKLGGVLLTKQAPNPHTGKAYRKSVASHRLSLYLFFSLSLG